MIRTALSYSSGIYQIKSIITNRIYIGSAVNLKRRILEGHINDLKKNKHVNKLLQRHFNKYGINDFEFGIIEFCSKEKLIEREQYYIDTLKPKLNLSKIAGSLLGYKWSEESKQRSSIAKTGDKNPGYGIPKTEAQKEPISKRHAGKIVSEETRQKLRESRINYKHSEETRKKIGEHSKGNKNCLGRKASEETKKKIGQATKKRMTPEMKKHLSDCQKGEKSKNFGTILWNKGLTYSLK